MKKTSVNLGMSENHKRCKLKKIKSCFYENYLLQNCFVSLLDN